MPIIGPLIGGVLGAGIYDLFIGRFLPTEGEPRPGDRDETRRVTGDAAA